MDEPELPLSGAALRDRQLVRVGDTVRRPAGPWTASVHVLLRHLRANGFDLAPSPRGLDSSGREILSYVEGRDIGLPELLTDDGVRRLGGLAKRLRSALAGYQCPPDAVWLHAKGAPRTGEAMQHGDLGPWNLLWGADSEIVGVLDWDFVGPGDPWYDTGHLAWFTVPLMSDERARSRGFSDPLDRQARLAAFAAGAGMSSDEVVEVAVRAQAEYERRVVARGSSADAGQWATFLELGFHRNARADRAWTVERFA